MNRRRIISKYQVGNFIFLCCAFFLGLVFSTYISQIFKIYYIWYAGIENWAFFIGGLVVLAFGLSIIGSLFIARKLIFDTIFIYLTSLVLFLTYWTIFFINARPQYGMFLFAVVPIVIGLLVSLMTYIWKRNGGAIVLIFFICGVVFAGVVRIVFPVNVVSTLNLIRFSFLSIAFVVAAYLFGFIGMFKGRKFYVLLTVILMFLSILYPFDLNNVVNNKCVAQSKDLKSLACVSKYETGKRMVEVMFGKYSDKSESFIFVENNKINNFTYPIDDTSRLFMYLLLLQHPAPKTVLLAGDVPLGAIETYKTVYSLQELTLFPFDINDSLSKARLANPSIYSQIKIFDSKDELTSKFDETMVFLPSFNTVNIASLINNLLAKVTQEGTFIFVGTASNYDILMGPVQSWLKMFFKNSQVLQYGSLMAVIASNNETYVSISPDVLKLRYLDMKITYDYTKVRTFIETVKPFTPVGNVANTSSKLSASNIALIDDYVFPGTYKGARYFAYIALLFILIYLTKYLFLHKTDRLLVFYYSDLFFTAMISSSLFILSVIYYQLNWGEIYSKLPIAIAIFIVGIIFAALFYYYLGIEKFYAYYLIIAAAIVVQVNLSWMVLMRKIDFSPYVWLYMLLFGVTTVFSLSNVIVKPKDILDVRKVLYLSGLMSAGIGVGVIICTQIFIPLLGMDYSSYLLFLCSLVTLIFHAIIFGRSRESI